MTSRIVQAVSKYKLYTLLLLIVAVTVGCAIGHSAPTKTALQLQAFQSREIAASEKIVFASVMSVFQDLGYAVNSADADTGLITAKSPTNLTYVPFVGNVMKDMRATAFIEYADENKTRVRLNFVENEQSSSKKGRTSTREKPVEDPAFYQRAFDLIEQSAFVRANR